MLHLTENTQELAKYPAVTRDISMVVPKEILVGQIEDVIEKKGGVQKEESGWMLAAFGSAIFAALTSILGKVGITGSSPISVRRCAPAWCSSWRGSWCLCRQAGPGEGGAQK